MNEAARPHIPAPRRRWLQFSLRTRLAGMAAIAVALGLFRVAANDDSGPLFPLRWDWPPIFVNIEISIRFIALSLGAAFLGGAIGAVVGRVLGGDKEGGSIMGVFVGCLVSILCLIVASIAVLVLGYGYGP